MWNLGACCGYAAAALSIVAFGSFAVPIKCKAARAISVDPLVLQTYKIGACFMTSWIVLLLGVKFSFTPYGFVSGLLMVPGGTAGYYGVRNAGLAVSQGIWSSLKVLVAFSWGLFIFQEPVESKTATAMAVCLMLIGLAGMSYFASNPRDPMNTDIGYEPLLQSEVLLESGSQPEDDLSGFLCGLSPRYLGILGAIIDGLYGGSVLVPMHFAAKESIDLKGLGFLISFGIGCTTVVSLVWIGRWAVLAVREESCILGFKKLPSFHVMTIGPYASLAGLIWSVGNVSSILSVAMLGQGLGYSLVQSQLIVAGMWAVFFYREIRGQRRIFYWFLCASVTLLSILLLTNQHSDMPTVKSSSRE